MYFDGGTEVASLTGKVYGAESHMSVRIFDNFEKFGESDNARNEFASRLNPNQFEINICFFLLAKNIQVLWYQIYKLVLAKD